MVILGGDIRKFFLLVVGFALLLSACSEVSYIQKNSPASAYKDYRPEDQNRASVLGVGSPVSKQEMRAKSTFSVKGRRDLANVMARMAGVYNVAVRWGDGVRTNKLENILIADLNFEEARSYIEDVFGVQIIREGKRRLLVLPSVNEKMVTKFSPGINITLAQAVRGLAEQCDYNIVINENKSKLVETLVTTSLKNVTCFDAFGALLSPHGMSLEDHGDYYIVGGFPQRQWRLNLLEPLREETSEVTYTSSLSSKESESGGGIGEVSGSSEVRVGVQRQLWEELQADLNALIENACTELQNSIELPKAGHLLLPPSEGQTESGAYQQNTTSNNDENDEEEKICGYVTINKSVGLVQMRAPKDILDEADEIIRRVEDIASRRLLLEARVLAVTRKRDFIQGSDLKFGAGTSGSTAESDVTVFGGSQAKNVTTSVTSAIGSFLTSLGTGQDGSYLGANVGDINAVVRMVEEYGTTYNLMQPMMELMDRQKATLIDGENKIYTKSEVTSITNVSGGVDDSLKREVKAQFIGLQFSASAQIADEGELHTVSIQIPITSFIENFTVSVTFKGDPVIDTIPVTSTRIIDQKVRIRDGEVKVIGGLTKTLAIDKESGQPLLREMPAFGKLFNDENVTFEEVEFVVLLQVRRLY